MVKKKKGKKRSSKSLLKNRKFLFGVAIVLAIVVVAGFASFAGGAKNNGRVFSWKQGKVLNNYRSTTIPPQDYQFINYAGADWGGEYYGLYTEKTNPTLGSRELAVGDQGEDVRALKGALKYIGKFRVWSGSSTDDKVETTEIKTMNNTHDSVFEKIDTNSNIFDEATAKAVRMLDKPQLFSSYGKFMADNKLNDYEQIRIMLTAASNWDQLTDGGKMMILTTGTSSASSGVGKPDPAKYTVKTTTFRGQNILRKKGESIMDTYPRMSFAISKITDGSDKTSSAKSFNLNTISGQYAKYVQSTLNLAIDWGHSGAIPKCTVSGTYNDNTKKTIKAFEKFYGLTEDGKWDSRLEFHVLMELGYSLQG